MDDMIYDRGRGPEIIGTRITVYNLMPDFLDSQRTERQIAEFYELTVEQVAAARAYILNNAETVLARHREIEAKIEENVAKQPPRAKSRLSRFGEWVADRDRHSEDHGPNSSNNGSKNGFPTFLEWLAIRESEPKVGG